jgi:polysaccharide export outer membrane protein
MYRSILSRLATATLATLMLVGCASQGSDLPLLPQAPSVDQSYMLGAGDKLQIMVFGAEDVNGQFTVADSGLVGAPLIGQIKAAGKTVAQLQEEVRRRLAQGYIKDPQVGIEVLTYRPFYIVGEVQHPGTYPYAAGSTVLSAVATAGGYTYRANEGYAVVERKENGKTIKGRAAPNMPILPDDIIRVPERFF